MEVRDERNTRLSDGSKGCEAYSSGAPMNNKQQEGCYKMAGVIEQ